MEIATLPQEYARKKSVKKDGQGSFAMKVMYYALNIIPASFDISMLFNTVHTQAFVSSKKYMPHPLPYFKVNIYPFPLPHFASICFAYL